MSRSERAPAVALLYGAAFALILLAAACLGAALVAEGTGTGPPLIALVASGGGLLLLGVGVLRARPSRHGA